MNVTLATAIKNLNTWTTFQQKKKILNKFPVVTKQNHFDYTIFHTSGICTVWIWGIFTLVIDLLRHFSAFSHKTNSWDGTLHLALSYDYSTAYLIMIFGVCSLKQFDAGFCRCVQLNSKLSVACKPANEHVYGAVPLAMFRLR